MSSCICTLLRACHADEGCSSHRLKLEESIRGKRGAGGGGNAGVGANCLDCRSEWIGKAAVHVGPPLPPPLPCSIHPVPSLLLLSLLTSELLASMLASVTHVRALSPSPPPAAGSFFLNEKPNGIFIILLINQTIRATSCCCWHVYN